MWVSNDPSTPSTLVDNTDPATIERVSRWAISKYRYAHKAGGRNETHLSTCDDIEIVFDLHDGYYGCECNSGSGCEYAILEATLTCSHGVSRDFEYGEFGLVPGLLAELEAWEMRVREQTGNPVIIVGKLPADAEDVLPMIVVYHNTVDYPGLYVARQHDIGVGRVAVHPEPLKVSPSLQEVRAVVPVGMMAIPPAGNDDPNIVEVYV